MTTDPGRHRVDSARGWLVVAAAALSMFTVFGILALIGGGVVFYLGTTAGMPVENAIWMAIPFSLFGGVGGMTIFTHIVSERRGPARFTDPG